MFVTYDSKGFEYATKTIAPLCDYARETLNASADYRRADEYRKRGLVTLAIYLEECAQEGDKRASEAINALPEALRNDEITHYHRAYCEWRDSGFNAVRLAIILERI